MINLKTLISDLSVETGFGLDLQVSATDGLRVYEIRFTGLNREQSFYFKLSRSWRSTEVSFQPDSFSREVVNFICNEIQSKASLVNVHLENYESAISHLLFRINGRLWSDYQFIENQPVVLEFHAEVLTSESALEHGLLTYEERLLIVFVVRLFSMLLPAETESYKNADEVVGFPEGAVTSVQVNRYERDPRNRKEALRIHGYLCKGCGFDFESFYGKIGKDFVIVHHTTPVSKLGEDYVLDPVSDLVPLCANCHAMVHRRNPPYSVEELQSLIKPNS